jgi:hypothetical protein
MANDPKKPGGTKPQGSVTPPAGSAPSPAHPPTEREHPGQSAATGKPPPAAAKRDTEEAPNVSSGAADGNPSTQTGQQARPEELRADQDGDGRVDPEVGNRPRHEGDPLAPKPLGQSPEEDARNRERSARGERPGAEGDDEEEAARERADLAQRPPRVNDTGAPMTLPGLRSTVPTGPPRIPGEEEHAIPRREPGAPMAMPPGGPAARAVGAGGRKPADPAADYWRLVHAEAGITQPHRTATVVGSARPAILSAAGRTDAEFRADVQAYQQRKADRGLAEKVPELESQLADVEKRIREDQLGGPRQSARQDRAQSLKMEIARAKDSRRTMIQTNPRDDLQNRRNELIRQIHRVDGESVRAGVPEDEADRRTEDLRAQLAELEDEMSAV